MSHCCHDPRCPTSGPPYEKVVEYPHKLHWDIHGRKGKACRILKSEGLSIHIEFEDGFNFVTDRRAVRRSA